MKAGLMLMMSVCNLLLFMFMDCWMLYFYTPLLLLILLIYCMEGFDGVFYLDELSSLMVFLSLLVLVFSLYASHGDFLKTLMFWLMSCFTFMSFMFCDFIYFYFSFEAVFLFMFFFLLGWGKSLERIQASFYMLFFTLTFSLPFLFMILLYKIFFIPMNFLINFFSFPMLLGFTAVLLFSVKLPIYGFHSWLPKAHVESPVEGSMILAGVMLKIGGYGLVRFLPSLSFCAFHKSWFISFLFFLSILGGALLALICSRQSDLKMMIAYSSIVHMSLGLAGLLSQTYWGLKGFILMMVAHGLVSPTLFFLMNYVYDSTYSRSVFILKGLIFLSPLFCLLWFVSCFLNLGFPPFMNFFSEILICSSLSFLSSLEWALTFFLLFFSGVYSILMFNHLAHGFNFSSFFFFSPSIMNLTCFCLFYFILLYPYCFF